MSNPVSYSISEDWDADGPRGSLSEHQRFEQLYSRYGAFVWRTLRRFGIVEPNLDDAMQDVFVVAHRKLSEFDGESPRAWLAAIARRVAADNRRKRATHPVCDRESQHDLAIAMESVKRADEHSTRESAVRLVHRLLESLDDEKREVFVLAELEGMSMQEVAQVVEINVNTAYSRLRAARTVMKAEYARLIAREKWRMP